MTDREWIEVVKAKFGYPDPILPVFYSNEAWARRHDDQNYQWQEGDLDREKTKSGLSDLGLDLTGI